MSVKCLSKLWVIRIKEEIIIYLLKSKVDLFSQLIACKPYYIKCLTKKTPHFCEVLK